MKLIVDEANNHSNPDNAGEIGSLYNNGTFMAAANNDPNGYFHHNPDIANYNDRYQLQYYTLEDLTDLNQENATIDSYLKSAAAQLQTHHVDAFRLDAVKDVTWGWQYSFANAVFNNAPSFLYGEWDQGSTSDPLYPDSYKFANNSGISLLDFPLNTAIRDVFASNNAFSEVDSTINTENANFTYPNDLVTFFDSQDESRFLTLNNNQNRLQEAMAFLLTGRGIPIIFYGDEQYLFNNSTGSDGNPVPTPTTGSGCRLSALPPMPTSSSLSWQRCVRPTMLSVMVRGSSAGSIVMSISMSGNSSMTLCSLPSTRMTPPRTRLPVSTRRWLQARTRIILADCREATL